MWATCQCSASSGYHAEFHKASYQKHTDLLTVGLAVRIFPATTQTFMNNTALSENGRGMAWAWHGMCELVFNEFIIFPQDRRFCSMKLLSATTGQKAQYTALKMH
jgi:hypothetical protein